jgi:hypothetical protein
MSSYFRMRRDPGASPKKSRSRRCTIVTSWRSLRRITCSGGIIPGSVRCFGRRGYAGPHFRRCRNGLLSKATRSAGTAQLIRMQILRGLEALRDDAARITVLRQSLLTATGPRDRGVRSCPVGWLTGSYPLPPATPDVCSSFFKRRSAGEPGAVSAPPPASGPARHGSPADARRACPSA